MPRMTAGKRSELESFWRAHLDGWRYSELNRKRPVVARRSGVGWRGRPVPRQEIIEPAHRMAMRHALEHVFEVGVSFFKAPKDALVK